MSVGAWVAAGAICGLVIGALLGTHVADGGGDIQELNDLAGTFVAVMCLIVGTLIGWGVGRARQESASGPPEPPQDNAEPPYWPPPAGWSPPVEDDADERT